MCLGSQFSTVGMHAGREERLAARKMQPVQLRGRGRRYSSVVLQQTAEDRSFFGSVGPSRVEPPHHCARCVSQANTMSRLCLVLLLVE